ncbi:Dual specificity protein phosphatase 1B [Hondaea fermentalgiana]|uniref:Dual specificity protein phosphatase 1B n=1 Tax=Hondaea fermentalgiana TaxID=2315210 RepID=A0A2R5G4K6_9STRA|nr:Dual specificity protein phosphatase 1B [Hondaea fermentalgiana]|eukprot:GBG25920.1 Dual specificity protein phosphatase 1B [Hondaea fermentalgiana]
MRILPGAAAAGAAQQGAAAPRDEEEAKDSDGDANVQREERRSKNRNDPRSMERSGSKNTASPKADNDDDLQDQDQSANGQAKGKSKAKTTEGDNDEEGEEEEDDDDNDDDDDDDDNEDDGEDKTRRRRSKRARKNRMDLSKVLNEEDNAMESDSDDGGGGAASSDEDNIDGGRRTRSSARTRRRRSRHSSNDAGDEDDDEEVAAAAAAKKKRTRRRRYDDDDDDDDDIVNGDNEDNDEDAETGGAEEEEEEEEDDDDEDYQEDDDKKSGIRRRRRSSRSSELRTKGREDPLSAARRMKAEKRWKVREDTRAGKRGSTRRGKSAEEADEDFSANNVSSEESEDAGAEGLVDEEVNGSDSAGSSAEASSATKSRSKAPGRARAMSLDSTGREARLAGASPSGSTSSSRAEPRKRGRPAMSATAFARQALKRRRPDPKDLKRRVAEAANRRPSANHLKPISSTSSSTSSISTTLSRPSTAGSRAGSNLGAPADDLIKLGSDQRSKSHGASGVGSRGEHASSKATLDRRMSGSSESSRAAGSLQRQQQDQPSVTPLKANSLDAGQLATLKAKLKGSTPNAGAVRARPGSLFRAIGQRSGASASPTPTSELTPEQRKTREAVAMALALKKKKQAPGVDTGSNGSAPGSKNASPIVKAAAASIKPPSLSSSDMGRGKSPVHAQKRPLVSSKTGSAGMAKLSSMADASAGTTKTEGVGASLNAGASSSTAAAGSIAPSSAKKQKRPKLRKHIKKPGGIDLSPPADTRTHWNASEVIKGFLYVGAGWDQNQRCLVNRKADPVELKASRLSWCRDHNMCYALNMAGSPMQRELRGISYVLPETRSVRIDVNDLDTWDEKTMRAGFDRGAEFIEEAWKAHSVAKERCLLASNSQVRIVPPTIFVHCVAGVNRSPMCVVWWLCKYHGVRIRDAWELVRRRRDQGAHWTDVTLGGPSPPEGYVPSEEDLERAATRKFQHRYDVVSKKLVLDFVPLEPPPEDAKDRSANPESDATKDTAQANSKSESTSDAEPVKKEQGDEAAKNGEATKNESNADASKDAATSGDAPAEKLEPSESRVAAPAAPSGIMSAAVAKAASESGNPDEPAVVLPPSVKYPKALWFINAEKHLSQFFKRSVEPEQLVAPLPNQQ